MQVSLRLVRVFIPYCLDLSKIFSFISPDRLASGDIDSSNHCRLWRMGKKFGMDVVDKRERFSPYQKLNSNIFQVSIFILFQWLYGQLLGLGCSFTLLILYTAVVTPWTGIGLSQVHHLQKGQHKSVINTHKHLCLYLVSNPPTEEKNKNIIRNNCTLICFPSSYWSH
jgi:hypothetical protein